MVDGERSGVQSGVSGTPAQPLDEALFRPGYLRAFVTRFAAATSLAFGVCSGLLYVTLDESLEGGYAVAHTVLWNTLSLLWRHVLFSAALQCALLAAAVALIALVASHKVAGPLFRMRRFLAAFRAGQPIPGGLRLRAGDQVQPFAAALEDSFSRLLGEIRCTADEIERVAARIEAGEKTGPEELAALRVRVERFKVE